MSEVDYNLEEAFADGTEQFSLSHYSLEETTSMLGRANWPCLGFGDQRWMGNQLPYTEAAGSSLSHWIWHTWLC